MIRQSGSIQLLGTRAGPWVVRTKENIEIVRNRLRQKQKVSARKLSREVGISATSVRRILQIDLGLKPYKKIIEPSLFDDQTETVCKLGLNYGCTKSNSQPIQFLDLRGIGFGFGFDRV